MKKGMLKNFWMDFVPACAFVSISLFAAACSGDDVAGGASGDAGITAVTDREVAGVSQKGPFVTGSAVTVQELDGITLKQTGKSFKGRIKSDKGDFAIKDINLSSQYAILEASGYYRDEISGKKSTGTVTLYALTDLSNRKTVNINLLTHLEYERVKYLVTQKKKSIAEAKAQAANEILSSFDINGEFAESEDLNIFKSGDGNAALLAVSVLMQSDVDVAGLTERMGEFSVAIAEGGSWDDADTKVAIADWACDTDLKGTLANVRKNIENWKYADTIPAFEKYVTNFWWNNYGLGACNSKRENETKRNINKLSKLYNEYFVCEKGRWVIPVEEKSSSSKTAKSSSSGTAKSSSLVSSSSLALSSSSCSETNESSSFAEVSSSSYFDPFAQKSSSSGVVQKKDSLPDLPDELSFVEKYLEKKTEYTEYADGKQVVWRGHASPMHRYYYSLSDSTVAPWDSAASALIKEAVTNGFEYMGSYSNDSLDNIYVNDSHVYSKTSGGRVYTIVITMHELYYVNVTVYNYFFLKMIERDLNFEEIPTEKRKDYTSPQYRDLPEDLKFIRDAFSWPNRESKSYSNDSLWTCWLFSALLDTDGTDSLLEAKVKADEYAVMMETHGFSLKSRDDYTVAELQSMGYTSTEKSYGYSSMGREKENEVVTLYRYEKDVEGFRYVAEVYAGIAFVVGNMAWYETRANIKITIYDK